MRGFFWGQIDVSAIGRSGASLVSCTEKKRDGSFWSGERQRPLTAEGAENAENGGGLGNGEPLRNAERPATAPHAKFTRRRLAARARRNGLDWAGGSLKGSDSRARGNALGRGANGPTQTCRPERAEHPLSPFQGYGSRLNRSTTQGVAPGYRLSPRWGCWRGTATGRGRL